MESCVYPILTRIYNIGHIHKTNFAQTQFSTSYPKKHVFSKPELRSTFATATATATAIATAMSRFAVNRNEKPRPDFNQVEC